MMFKMHSSAVNKQLCNKLRSINNITSHRRRPASRNRQLDSGIRRNDDIRCKQQGIKHGGIHSTQGVALITVLLVVTLATTAAVAMSSRQHIDIRRTENTLYVSQAAQYLSGVEFWATQILAKDFKDNKTDDSSEAWATHLPPLPVEGGYVSGYVEDLQGRINLNNLQNNKTSKQTQARLKRLFAKLEINDGLVNALLDWIDADQEVRFPGGAEDGYYLGLQPPYRAANRILQSSSELMLLKDMSKEQIAKLDPYISTLPQTTKININTAGSAVLMTLADNLSDTEIQTLIAKRKDKPYTKIEDFLAEKVFAGKNILAEGLSVNSNYFLLHAETGIGTLIQYRSTLLERDDKGKIKTLMRMEGLI